MSTIEIQIGRIKLTNQNLPTNLPMNTDDDFILLFHSRIFEKSCHENMV